MKAIFTEKENMFWREESLSCLKSSVHLPLAPELVRPVTQSGAQEVSVRHRHHRDTGDHWPRGLGVWAREEDEVVDQELVIQQRAYGDNHDLETLSPDHFHLCVA